MNKEETLEQLRDIIKPYINSEEGFENFTENTDFISDLNINSANLVDIILDVEDHFKIHIDNESMENGRCQINIRNNRFQVKGDWKRQI
jgi:acyl carrier protein